PIRLGILFGGLAGAAAVVAWARVAGTSTDPGGVTVRGLFRTRTFAWPDIQAIQIELNPGGHFDDRGPKQVAILYDPAGHPVPLPHVNEKHLGRLQLSLAAEIEAMRMAWEYGRGPHWAPIASVQRTVERRVKYRFTSWVVGLYAAMLATPIALVIFVVG